MHIKIGDTIYDGVGYPMMVVLTDRDKRNIVNMLPDHYRYAQVPALSDWKEIEAWMDEGMDGILENVDTEALWDRYEKAQRRKRIAYAIGMCHVIKDMIVLEDKTGKHLKINLEAQRRWRRYDSAIQELTIKLLEEWEAKDEN